MLYFFPFPTEEFRKCGTRFYFPYCRNIVQIVIRFSVLYVKTPANAEIYRIKLSFTYYMIYFDILKE